MSIVNISLITSPGAICSPVLQDEETLGDVSSVGGRSLFRMQILHDLDTLLIMQERLTQIRDSFSQHVFSTPAGALVLNSFDRATGETAFERYLNALISASQNPRFFRFPEEQREPVLRRIALMQIVQRQLQQLTLSQVTLIRLRQLELRGLEQGRMESGVGQTLAAVRDLIQETSPMFVPQAQLTHAEISRLMRAECLPIIIVPPPPVTPVTAVTPIEPPASEVVTTVPPEPASAPVGLTPEQAREERYNYELGAVSLIFQNIRGVNSRYDIDNNSVIFTVAPDADLSAIRARFERYGQRFLGLSAGAIIEVRRSGEIHAWETPLDDADFRELRREVLRREGLSGWLLDVAFAIGPFAMCVRGLPEYSSGCSGTEFDPPLGISLRLPHYSDNGHIAITPRFGAAIFFAQRDSYNFREGIMLRLSDGVELDVPIRLSRNLTLEPYITADIGTYFPLRTVYDNEVGPGNYFILSIEGSIGLRFIIRINDQLYLTLAGGTSLHWSMGCIDGRCISIMPANETPVSGSFQAGVMFDRW